MTTVTVSSKYQVVIPKRVRQSLYIQPGQKMQMLEYGGILSWFPYAPFRRQKARSPGLTQNHNVKKRTENYEPC